MRPQGRPMPSLVSEIPSVAPAGLSLRRDEAVGVLLPGSVLDIDLISPLTDAAQEQWGAAVAGADVGAVIQTGEQVRAITAMVDPGAILSLDRKDELLRHDDIPVRRTPLRRAHDDRPVRRLSRAARGESPMHPRRVLSAARYRR